MLIASAYSKGWGHNGGRQEITIQILTRMYLYIIQLLKLRRCTLVFIHHCPRGFGSCTAKRRLASHEEVGTFSSLWYDLMGFFRCGTWQMSRSSSRTVSFPWGRTPPRSQGASVSRAPTSTGLKTVSMDCLERFWLNRNIYRSNTLSLIDATLYFIKSSFKAAPQGITW